MLVRIIHKSRCNHSKTRQINQNRTGNKRIKQRHAQKYLPNAEYRSPNGHNRLRN